MDELDIARFWGKIDRSAGPDGCWLWLCSRNAKGYGTFTVTRGGRRNEGAHRWAFELTYGPIGTGLCVCHRCDNPPCCNPTHLFLGTQSENLRDMVAKGRQGGYPANHPNRPRGDRHVNSRLSETLVREIREWLSAGVLDSEIARRLGVNPETIRNVRLGKTWRHVI
jgi:hypothetical protein